MANKITWEFKLDNRKNIGFKSDAALQEFLETLEELSNQGINLQDTDYFNNLYENTVSNGHNLLKSSKIFSLETKLVSPMSEVVGQFLFRILFCRKELRHFLYQARSNPETELEIILDFDLQNEESKALAALPWELMYSPTANEPSPENKAEGSYGFFVSKWASLYRRYQHLQNSEDNKKELHISIAFLSETLDSVKEVCGRLKKLADEVEKKNSNIYFHFLNIEEETGDVGLLVKGDLEKIFLKEKNTASTSINKIVHLFCDVAMTEYGNKNQFALCFNGAGPEEVSLEEILMQFYNGPILPDPSLKLIVLQAWKEDSSFFYSGFEEIASRLIAKYGIDIISMPYVINEKRFADWNAAFFRSLYEGLADSKSLIRIVRELRNDMSSKSYSYGFPILYLNGGDKVLLDKNFSSAQKSSNFGSTEVNTEQNNPFVDEYRNLAPADLEVLQKDLQDLLRQIIQDSYLITDSTPKFANKKANEQTNLRLSAIKLLLRK
ncbi:MAG: hypothetical protein INR73_11570 [Williamsia sp.]|nr:hypothetical protein [Williamsia sp.]